MKLLNFSHPLTSEALTTLEEMTRESVQEIRIPVQIDFERPIKGQLETVVRAGLKAKENDSIFIPPALSFAAAAVGEGIGLPAGRMVVMKSVGMPRRFIPAEIV